MKFRLVNHNKLKSSLMNKKSILLFFMAIFLFLFATGQDFPARPKPPRLVNDYTGVLKKSEQSILEQKLVQFNNATSTQIAIAIVPTLNGYDKSDYSFRLAEQWGIGQKGKNNGILILVKPKTSLEKGEVFIATGYGLESVVPDAIAKRIVEVEVLPEFRAGNYYKGLDNAIATLMSLTKGEFTADDYARSHKPDLGPQIGTVIFILFFLFFGFFGRILRARTYAAGHHVPFWTALFLASSMNRGHSGHFGSFSSGSGGFGGFGGGSFGGGGAGGSW